MKKEVVIILTITLIIIIGYIIRLQGEEVLEQTLETSITPEQGIDRDDNNEQEGGEKQMKYPQPPAMQIDETKSYSAIIKTSEGDITVDLTADSTPKTVNNFVFLAQEGFYNDTIFHRVIKNFMIQGGDPAGTGAGGPGYTFEDEITPDQAFDGPGILAMANRGPDTNGSQFFITHGEAPWLSGAHTIFGRVSDGIDVVNKIALSPTGQGDRPTKDITIQSIEIVAK